MSAEVGAGETVQEEAVQKAVQAKGFEVADDRLRDLDLDAWRSDLQRLHGTMDQVVKEFINLQTGQLDAVAHELSMQSAKIILKEKSFNELSESIAGFVEDEAKRLQNLGFDALSNPEDDARHEAYDADLPGPAALHRINRMWRKATKFFETQNVAKDRETASALQEQQSQFENQLAEAQLQFEKRFEQKEQEIEDVKKQLAASALQVEELQAAATNKDGAKAQLTNELSELKDDVDNSRREFAGLLEKIDAMESNQKRKEYEWDAEREELLRQREELKSESEGSETQLQSALAREEELKKKCDERARKLEDMKRVMDDQELEMSKKLERVEQYVKERQATAFHTEKKFQDSERMAERWQSEVQRCQAEKDKLSVLLLQLEDRQKQQDVVLQQTLEKHRQELAGLQEKLRRTEQQGREANQELLLQREREYQGKVALEKEREKERAAAELKRKQQEVQIKDQQLRAAKQRIQDLESSLSSASTSLGSTPRTNSPSSRVSTSQGRRPSSGGRDGLPPLSAR